ncbi:D-TA family PLP-dependent enzyme [Labrys monachus]|uniref:D-serine deaminase-like pyridoxal phosphate-dependent protein n=1 Tax=Labrys monachus TaxID=217067 RepID=A0ABU0FFW4_9HYPH|nr:D-TA family PLP-dependent enzyme [Labrys monachus]MDQ0392940.1 D-serine deaminase-like pyridoxal phosphate-dependent protein [Labrys monachus]
METTDFPSVETPAVLVDLDIAARNIARYQAYCDEHGIRLRPHIKTHKLPRMAGLQLSAGAVGITCQKLSEADAMTAGTPIDDVLLTYDIVGPAKHAHLRALAERIKLSVVADSGAVVEGLSAAMRDGRQPLTVLVECDTGAHRCGVATPEAAAELALRIDGAPGLRFGGLMTYPPVGGTGAVQAFMTRAKSLIESLGLAVETITSGGSPDMWRAHEAPVVTEYRPGTYVYNDRSLVERGICGFDDCALSVLATVVSVPDPHRAIIDAGSKVLTSDLLGLHGHGHVLGRPDIAVDQLSEEHGRLVSERPVGFAVGDKVRIVPNHACVVSNMLDEVVLVRGEAVIGKEPVAARGKVW